MWCNFFFAEKPGNVYEIRQKFAKLALFAVVVEKNDCFVKVTIYVESSSNHVLIPFFTEQKP